MPGPPRPRGNRKRPRPKAEQPEAEPKKRRRDRLGKRLDVYSTRQAAIKLWIGAGIVAVVGLCVVADAKPLAERIGRFTMGKDAVVNPKPYAVMGWCLVAVGVFTAAYAFFNSGRKFEIRKRGIRYSSAWKRREMKWGEIISWNVTRHVVIDLNTVSKTEVPSGVEIHICSEDDSIHLSRTFMALVSDPEWLITTIARYADVEPIEHGEGGGDYPTRPRKKRSSRSPDGRRPRKKKKKPAGAGSNANLSKVVAGKLGSGMEAEEVMRWLQRAKGLPRPAAEEILAKAVAEHPEHFETFD